ncbi:MAG: alpha-mannosidase, partial [Armatimonadetes bacterium]|nr:alpha-mannosidase [Armatimonadota bacterium]
MAGHTLHVISHSHWDREWYLPLELHRRRLVTLLDDLLEVFDRDPAFGSFHLDGQAIPLEDYLAIRPQQRARLQRAAQARRLTVGPWYVLQDEFLTSAEAQARNLLYGLRAAAEFAPPLMVGYLADSFGHIGQMPALLRGFGIDNAVFGRGLRKFDPSADPALPAGERGYHSELTWRGADGAEILGVLMTNWYSNAMDIPSEPAACVARFGAIRDAAARYATTPHLLLMNGCDHTPCQLNISELIATGRAGLDETIVHSRLDDYLAAVRDSLGELEVATGELRSEYTDGWGTLTDVLSARLYLKQANWRCQGELEHYLEPLQALGGLLGLAPDRDFRAYLWKLLLQNHPHDSICGCSIDPVHREMETRFEKVEQLAGQLAGEGLQALATQVDTSPLPDGASAVVVFNPLGFDREELVEAVLDWPEETALAALRVTNAAGEELPAELAEDQGRVWDYDLPADRFRVPYYRRRVVVRFQAAVPALGYATFTVTPLATAP